MSPSVVYTNLGCRHIYNQRFTKKRKKNTKVGNYLGLVINTYY